VRKRGNALKQETQNELERFRDYLREQEKSSHTIEKYCRDVRKFLMFADEDWDKNTIATVYKGNIIKNLIMDCQSYTKYRPNETTGGIFVSWRRKEELPTGA